MFFDQTVRLITSLDKKSMEVTRRKLDSLIKPPGSFGKLEELSVQLAGIQRRPLPQCDQKVVILMAGDHGVVSEGVSAAPQEITFQMLSAFMKGVAGINVFSRMYGAKLVVVDVGVAREVNIPGILNYKIRQGTGNIVLGPAMTRDEAVKAVEVGINVAMKEIDKGAQLLATGEMGIGNTTPSSAILSVLAGIEPEEAVGRGSMVNDLVVEKKLWAVKEAIKINRPDPNDGVDVVAKIGGLEIAGLAGVILGAAARETPVIIDGFISTAAAMIACKIKAGTREYIIPSHLSGEKGHMLMLNYLNLQPMLNLDMRLGEGTGAVLAMGIVEAACRVMKEMASFEEAGLADLDKEKLMF